VFDQNGTQDYMSFFFSSPAQLVTLICLLSPPQIVMVDEDTGGIFLKLAINSQGRVYNMCVHIIVCLCVFTSGIMAVM